jgi:hypothetical protein
LSSTVTTSSAEDVTPIGGRADPAPSGAGSTASRTLPRNPGAVGSADHYFRFGISIDGAHAEPVPRSRPAACRGARRPCSVGAPPSAAPAPERCDTLQSDPGRRGSSRAMPRSAPAATTSPEQARQARHPR